MSFTGMMIALGVLALLFLIRIEICFRWNMRAIDVCYENAMTAIKNHTYTCHEDYWKDYDSVSYHRMIFDLTKWSFKAFFPTLVK